jgi:diaminohydroxyphosphoribosylaminopyrimidine deaminase / 5-amino-6-(5-phosphoribosylamino)uracil reductase
MATNEQRYIRRALRLARKGGDRPSSEPMVGAVVVAEDRIVGEGFAAAHSKDGAVMTAIEQAGERAARATIYTNADPCCDALDMDACLAQLVLASPARVVVGCALGKPEAGGSLARLSQAGVEIVTGVCEQECRELNERYLKYSQTALPFVTVKFAESLDGRIATSTGDSQWISGQASLRLAHQLRREHDAIMVGIGTVLSDDPRLTVRLVNGRDPLRVVIDSRLRVPLTARVLAEGAAHRTLIATTRLADRERVRELERLGAQVLIMPVRAGEPGVDLVELLQALGRKRIASVLVEGGAGVITSLLAERAVDRLVVAIAPKIIGRGTEAIGDLGIAHLRDAITFESIKTRKLGQDIIFDGRLRSAPQGRS